MLKRGMAMSKRGIVASKRKCLIKGLREHREESEGRKGFDGVQN